MRPSVVSGRNVLVKFLSEDAQHRMKLRYVFVLSDARYRRVKQ